MLIIFRIYFYKYVKDINYKCKNFKDRYNIQLYKESIFFYHIDSV